MATIAERLYAHRTETLTGGASAEVIGGIGAVVLAILGLANVVPGIVLPIASIVVGAAFVLEAGAMAVEYSNLVGTAAPAQRNEAYLGGGLSLKILSGFVGIILGVLALIGLAQTVLLGAAAVVFGTALLLNAPTAAEFEALEEGAAKRPQTPVLPGLAATGFVAQMASGLGVMILGILALAGVHPATLIMVSMLVLGFGILVNGPAMKGKILSVLGQE